MSADSDPTTGKKSSGGRRPSGMSAYVRAHAAHFVAVGALVGVARGLAL